MSTQRAAHRPKPCRRRAAALAALLAAAAIATVPCQAEPVTWGAWTQWGDLGNGRYRNPVLPADYSDLDAIRVGDDYYAISSTFQFSPGMAVLHSRDLVNWETVGHAVSDLTRGVILRRLMGWSSEPRPEKEVAFVVEFAKKALGLK